MLRLAADKFVTLKVDANANRKTVQGAGGTVEGGSEFVDQGGDSVIRDVARLDKRR